jgi:glyoxylase-like metal-dependent hydrolase (beta-lactamase superfamily II)
MFFRQVPVGTFQNFAYIIGDEKTHNSVIVDPAWEVDGLLSICEEAGFHVSHVINTHSHHDHIEGNDAVAKRTGAKVAMHESSPARKDISLKDGDSIQVGSFKIKILHTPGHCPDHICLEIDGKVLTGDTLFVGECGRTDLVGGDAGALYDSLFNKLMKLDDRTAVYPGHDYGAKPSSTIGEERSNNYTLKPRTKEEFIRFMAEP